MRAALIREFGGPEVLQIEEVSSPTLQQPNEILVRVRACALNRLDLWIRKGTRQTAPLPLILGTDCAGEVLAADTASDLRPGQRVAVLPNAPCLQCQRCLEGQQNLCRRLSVPGWHRQGTNAEEVVVPAVSAVPIPDDLDFVSAAALPITAVTAWHMLITRAHLMAGETVLIWAGASGVGTMAIQLARALGARVLATTGTPAKAELAYSLGAEAVFDHYRDDVAAEVKRCTKGSGADVVVDCVGASSFMQSMAAIRDGGRLITVGVTSGPEVTINLGEVYMREITILGCKQGTQAEFSRVMGLVEKGDLKPVIGKTFSLEEIGEAHRILEANEVTGKVAVIVD